MITLLEFAKTEPNGKVLLIPKSNSPTIDGYDLITAEHNYPYHAHPVATPDIWTMIEAAIADGQVEYGIYVAPTEPPVDPIILKIEFEIQQILDKGSQTWGYDNIISAASYSSSTNPIFKAESIALIKWRDDVWMWASAELNAIKRGDKSMPSNPLALIAEMPAQPNRPIS